MGIVNERSYVNPLTTKSISCPCSDSRCPKMEVEVVSLQLSRSKVIKVLDLSLSVAVEKIIEVFFSS